MRRTLMLMITTSLALLLVVGGVASSQQRKEQSTSSESPTTTKESGGDLSIQSTTVKASFASGSGANRLSVKVSNHGNLTSFESPAGQEAVFDGQEGYVLCTGDGATTHGHDTGSVESGFGSPTFSQPTAGTFPLTVTRNTTDGKLRLKQVWNKPDATEKDVTVAMTVTNRSSATLNDVNITRTGDFDVGSSPRDGADRGATTNDSAWLWDDQDSFESPSVGLMVTALSFGTPHSASIEDRNFWVSDPPRDRDQCWGSSENTPTAEGDFAMRMIYLLGDLGAGQSKTVRFVYERI